MSKKKNYKNYHKSNNRKKAFLKPNDFSTGFKKDFGYLINKEREHDTNRK